MGVVLKTSYVAKNTIDRPVGHRVVFDVGGIEASLSNKLVVLMLQASWKRMDQYVRKLPSCVFGPIVDGELRERIMPLLRSKEGESCYWPCLMGSALHSFAPHDSRGNSNPTSNSAFCV